MSKLTIEEIAEDYFAWRNRLQTKAPHLITFEAYLAAKLVTA